MTRSERDAAREQARRNTSAGVADEADRDARARRARAARPRSTASSRSARRARPDSGSPAAARCGADRPRRPGRRRRPARRPAAGRRPCRPDRPSGPCRPRRSGAPKCFSPAAANVSNVPCRIPWRADVDPRAGRHLAVHRQALGLEPPELVPGGQARHEHASWRSARAARRRACGRPPTGLPLCTSSVSSFSSSTQRARRSRAAPPRLRAARARAAVDDQSRRILGDLGVEVVHQHPQRGFLLPALAAKPAAVRSMDRELRSPTSDSTSACTADRNHRGGRYQ